MIEFGPKLRSTPVIEASKPVRMALTPMIVPVPMITPSTVRNARSLCDRMVWSASTMPLKNASLKVIGLFFDPQCFDRVQSGGTPRGINAEEESDSSRESEADDYRRPGQRHRDGCQIADQGRDNPSQSYADQSARGRKNGGFHKVLIHDVASARPQGLADSDLMSSLRDHRQHDVHN